VEWLLGKIKNRNIFGEYSRKKNSIWFVKIIVEWSNKKNLDAGNAAA